MQKTLEAWLEHWDEEALWAVFEDGAFERGANYADRGRVLAWEATAEGLRGTVQGTGRKTYDVRVRIPDPAPDAVVDSRCSCPVGIDCKHGVAVLLTALIEEVTPSPEPDPSEMVGRGRVRPQSAGGMDGDLPVQAWLIALSEQTRSPSVPERIIYVVEWFRTGKIRVVAWKTRLRKDGTYGRMEPYHGDGRSGARFLEPADERILRLVAGGYQPEGAAQVPGLLGELAQSGRAYLWGLDGPLLQAGATLAGTVGWECTEDGSQFPAVMVASPGDVVALASRPPWYLEPVTGRTGPLELDLPEHLAVALFEAPPVPTHLVADAAARLEAVAPELPRPKELAIRTIRGEAPVPVCSLEMIALAGPGKLRGEEPLPLARIWLEYAGVRLPVGARGESEVYRDGVRYVIGRDEGAEERALDQLDEAGLVVFDGAGDWLMFPAEGLDWAGFVAWGLPRLRAAGWRVEVAPDFPYRLVEPEEWYADVEGSGEDWFGLELGVEVEGERHALLPLLIQVIRESPEAMDQGLLDQLDPEAKLLLDLGDGRLLPVPARRLVPILRTLAELYDSATPVDTGQLRLPAARAGLLPALEDEAAPLRWQGEAGVRELGERLTRLERTESAAEPAGLRATLRDYQRAGVGWLQALASQGLGGALADDMGLGKTIQVLAHLLHEKAAGRATAPSLVVAPRSLLFNWEQEAARFAPELQVLRFHGTGRHQELASLPEQDLVLSTYSTVTRDVEALAQQPFHLVVLDEAQAVKNHQSRSAQAVRQLQAHQRLALTGTPLENHLGEFWSLFDFLMPGLLGDRDTFNRLFRRPIERGGDSGRQAALQQRIRPFLLRRTKEAIAPELPACTEVRYHAELTGAQRDLYETVRVAMHERVQQEVARRGLARSQLVVLDALLKLRQVCCDPRLLKMESARSVQQSAKLEQLKELLAELHAEGRRILLFSQFTGMLDLIEAELPALGIDYVKLTGRTRKREERVARFQAGEVPLFLISLKAGGTGLNLTAADAVIHYDPWWNPAVMQQATDRAHRIGQDKPVFVYHLLTRDTVEERITDLQARKAELGAWLLGGEGGSAPSLAMEDVEALFQPLE